MGNCQAIDAAALVIQHPSGTIERLYWPVTASEVMRLNPGHYVSLIIPLPGEDEDEDEDEVDNKKKKKKNNHPQVHEKRTVQFTRVKLLRPSDTLVLGHAYRLVTTQEVMKVLRAKKYAKAKKSQVEPERQSSCGESGKKSSKDKDLHQGWQRPRPAAPANPAAAARPKSWRPSLQSISEASS